MIHIPPPHSKARAHKDGSFLGVTDALRELRKVGDAKEVPLRWERAIHGTAKRLGISVTTRRLGSTESVTVYRTA